MKNNRSKAIRSEGVQKIAMPVKGKRGISPLVATVLLLAFAVAVGTMVVSYLSDTIKSGPCDKVSIGTEGGSIACYKNDQVAFILTNNGKKPIDNLKIRAVNANSKDVNEPQVALAIDQGSASKVSFPYITLDPSAVSITVFPIVKSEEGPEFCEESAIKLTLSTC